MTVARAMSLRDVARLPGLLLVVVALAVQLAAASVVLPVGAARAEGFDRLLAASICHDDAGAAGQGGTPAHHHAPDCALCPLCQAIAHAGVLLGPPVFAWARLAVSVARIVVLPPARAPPARFALATFARGPPALI